MNLVAIAGVPPEATPRTVAMGASGPVEVSDLGEDKRAMWMALAALGVGAVLGYTLLGDLVRRPA